MNYLDLIPSQTEREHLEREGFELSDRMMATLIFQAVPYYYDRMGKLERLTGETTDKELSEQIRARVQYENNAYYRFTSNDGKYVFMVKVDVDDYPGYELKGVFKDFFEAERYATEKYGRFKFYIEKYDLVDGDLPEHRSIGHINPNMLSEEDKGEEYHENIKEYDGDSIGEAYYVGGRMKDFWCTGDTIEEADAVNEFDVNRFENLFIPWIHPFEKGDIVYSTDDPNIYGIIDTTQEIWKDFLKRVEDGMYVDYSDASLTVQFLMEDGRFFHKHISPIYLEKAELDSIEDEDKRELLQQASWMVQGDMSLDFFCDTYTKYFENHKN